MGVTIPTARLRRREPRPADFRRQADREGADLGDDPLGIRKAAERIAAERAAEAAAREASVVHQLTEGLKRSSSRLAEGLAGLAKRKLDRESLDELEEILITSDMGAKVARAHREGVLRRTGSSARLPRTRSRRRWRRRFPPS